MRIFTDIVTLIILGIILLLIIASLYQAKMKRLFDALYTNNKDYFFKVYNELSTKLLLSKKDRMLIGINAYLYYEDYVKAQQLIETLNQAKLNLDKKILLYQKELSLYCKIKNHPKAKEALDKLKNCLQSHPAKESILKEANYQYNVDLNHDVAYIDSLLKDAINEKTVFMQGIYYLRIAVLSYYHKKTKDAMLYLNKSEEALKETVYHKKIMKARKNIKLLEEIL